MEHAGTEPVLTAPQRRSPHETPAHHYPWHRRAGPAPDSRIGNDDTMNNGISGNPIPHGALPGVDTAVRGTPPLLYEMCGLLTVQDGMTPNAQEAAQFEEALRLVHGTEVGAALLRDINACDIPPNKRPVCIFHNDDPYDDNASAFGYAELYGAPTIEFRAIQRDHADSENGRIDQAIDLFSDLVACYAENLGRPCTMLGFPPYRMSTFCTQIGRPLAQWQLDMEAYVEEASDDCEEFDAAVRIIVDWMAAPDLRPELRLVGLNLTRCPPLRGLDGVTTLDLAGNRISAFPPADQLPATVTTVNLAGNPVRDGADRYGDHLRCVMLGGAGCDVAHLRSVLPPEIQVMEMDPDHLQVLEKSIQLMKEFPVLNHGMVPVEAMESKGWTDDVMEKVYPADMLENAASHWLAPRPVNDAWRRAQKAQPNAAYAMTVMLGRLKGISDTAHLTNEAETIGDGNIRQRLAVLLQKMQRPGSEQFLTECLQIAKDGTEECNDRLLNTLNNLEIASQTADALAGLYDNRVDDLIQAGKEMLRRDAATRFIIGLMPQLDGRARAQALERRRARQQDTVANPNTAPNANAAGNEKADEIEEFLMLQLRLQSAGPLPSAQFKMEHGGLSYLTDADVEKARQRINDEANYGLVSFLGAWEPLQSVIRRTAPALWARSEKIKEHIYHDRGRLYAVLDRLPKVARGLFVHDAAHGLMAFEVRERRFWTRYDRLVDQHLTGHGLMRGDQDTLVRVCRMVNDDIQAMIHGETVRQFLSTKNVHLGSTTQWPEQPAWFKRLLKRI
jgi:hypothetical protein